MSQITWFQPHIVSRGTEFRLQNKDWLIIEKVNEHTYQKDKMPIVPDAPSYATTRLVCRSRSVTANMRIYMQVPFAGTEFAPADERALQATTTYEPVELKALRDLTTAGTKPLNTPRLLDESTQVQDHSGLVPGGFFICYVWETVPGVCLGDAFGSDPFWALDKRERSKIQAALPREFEKMAILGYAPLTLTASHLVWNARTEQLYFVGFRDCVWNLKPEERKWRRPLFKGWGVAKVPQSQLQRPGGLSRLTEEDVSKWEW